MQILNSKQKSNWLLIAITIFTCTLFIYNDFGIRIYVGYFILLIPLFYELFRTKKFYLQRPIFTYLGLIVLAVLLAYARTTARIDKDTILYLITMLICVVIACIVNPDYSQFEKAEKVIFTFAYLFAFLVILSRVWRDGYLSTFYKFLTVEAQNEVHYAIWHGYSCSIGGDDTFHNYIFMLATLCSLGRIAEKRSSWKKNYLQALFFIVASFLTGRRGEFITLLVLWISVGIYIMPHYQRRKVIGATIIVLLCSIPFIPRLLNSLVFSRYATTLLQIQAGSDTLSGRLELWTEAIELFKNHPIIGIGWGGYANSVSEGYRALHGNVYNAHNIYLQFLAEMGLVGFIIIMIGLVSLLVYTIKQTYKLRNNEELGFLKRLNGIALGIQVYFLIVGLIDPCFMKYYFWCFFLIAYICLQTVERGLKDYNLQAQKKSFRL